MADTYLTIRNGTYYYRRKVPEHLVAKFGQPIIQFSLKTKDKKNARKQRDLQNVQITQRFDALEDGEGKAANTQFKKLGDPETLRLSASELEQFVRQFVEDSKAATRQTLINERPAGQAREEWLENINLEHSILTSPEDLRRDEYVYDTGKKILKSKGAVWESIPDELQADFAETIRRGLIETVRMEFATLHDQFDRQHYDHKFDPSRSRSYHFGKLASEYLAYAIEEAQANKRNQKWIDKLKSHTALAVEAIGSETPISDVNFDRCKEFRALLARVPTNKGKHYPKLKLVEAINAAAKEQRSVLSHHTQSTYLDVFKHILDLGVSKGLLGNNPAAAFRPLVQNRISPADAKRPFTELQIRKFFVSDFYLDCRSDAVKPYSKPDRNWRFWMPLLSLHMGMRPNEICQMLITDIKKTNKGNWYVDVVASDEDDEDNAKTPNLKTIKTQTSRRKIPIHPELLKIGFIEFVKRPSVAKEQRLFSNLKPDMYGNFARYPLKRFNETYLPKAIKLEPRQSFYSFRHSFRDALRASKAHADTLRALGGWSQGSNISDNYGNNSNPDFHVEAIGKVVFDGLDLSPHYLKGMATKHDA